MGRGYSGTFAGIGSGTSKDNSSLGVYDERGYLFVASEEQPLEL